jgi:transcriptional regulator with XRE-family HTH domain
MPPLSDADRTRVALGLGQALRDRRTAVGRTLLDVATEIGVTEAALSDCERGRRLPSLALLLGWCHELDVLPTRLFTEVYLVGTNRRPAGRPAPPPDGRSR